VIGIPTCTTATGLTLIPAVTAITTITVLEVTLTVMEASIVPTWATKDIIPLAMGWACMVKSHSMSTPGRPSRVKY